MAEIVYKSITDLDVLSGSLDGSETLPVVKSGKTYRRSWTNFFGSGWMAQLLQAFSSFIAPNATHADDADTVGGESLATIHNAANLTGNINLDRIPAELTGKNAATATASASCTGNAATATKLQTARTIGGVLFDGAANINLPGVNTAGNQNTSGNANSASSTLLTSANAQPPAGKVLFSYGGNASDDLCIAYGVSGSETHQVSILSGNIKRRDGNGVSWTSSWY